MDYKSRIFDDFRNWFSISQIKHRLDTGFGLEINILHSGCVEITVLEHLIRRRVTIKAAKNYMTTLTDLFVFPAALQCTDNAGKKKIRAGENEADVRIRLQRVHHASLRLLLVPFARHARNHFHHPGRILHCRLEAVTTANGVDVTEIAHD